MIAFARAMQVLVFGLAGFMAINWLKGPEGMFATVVSTGLLWGALIDFAKEAGA